jgi:hypothetical protein
MNNDINYTRGLIFGSGVSSGSLYEVDLETNTTLSTNAGTWEVLTDSKTYSYDNNGTDLNGTTSNMIVIKPTLEGYKYNQAIVSASHDSSKLYWAEYSNTDDTVGIVQLNSYALNDVAKSMIDNNITTSFENNSTQIFNNTEVAYNRLFEIRKDKIEYLDNNVTITDINTTQRNFTLSAAAKSGYDSIAGIKTYSKYTHINRIQSTLKLLEANSTYSRADTWAVLENVDVNISQSSDINITSSKANIYAGIQIRHNSIKNYISIYDENWTQKWAISYATDYNTTMLETANDALINQTLNPVIRIKDNVLEFKVRDENNTLLSGVNNQYSHPAIKFDSIDRAEIRAKISSSAPTAEKLSVEVSNLSMASWNLDSIIINLNISNLNPTEHNITYIDYIGQDGNSENFAIAGSDDLNSSTLTLPIYVTNPDANYSLRFNTENNTTHYWYNFSDNKLYETNDGSDNFKNTITSSGDTLNFDANSTNWKAAQTQPESAPTIEMLYDRYRLKNFTNFNVDLNISDANGDDLTVTIVKTDSESIINVTPTNSSYSASTYNNGTIPLTISSNNKNGKATIVVVVSDGTTSVQRKFTVVVYDYISTEFNELLPQSIYENNSSSAIDFNTTTIYSQHPNIYRKYINGKNKIVVASNRYNNDGSITKRVLTDDQQIVSSTKKDNRYYSIDSNNIISIYSDTTKQSKIKEMKYLDDSNSSTVPFVEKYSTPTLKLYQDVNYSAVTYKSITAFKTAFQYGQNSLGVVRDDMTNSTMLFLDDISNTQGNLIHVAECGTVISSNAGTWSTTTVDGKETLIIKPDNNSSYKFNYGTAFALGDTGNIQRGQYYNSGDIAIAKYLHGDAMRSLHQIYTSNPHVVKTINTGWTYVSLPSSMTICDESIKSTLTNICNQSYSLQSIFKDSNIKTALKYSNGWSYWDSNTTINQAYQLDKFSAITASDGVLIKSSGLIDIDVPYDIYNNNIDETMNFITNEWSLASVTETKTVQEIQAMVASQNKTLKYILAFRKESLNVDKWFVYAPTNDDQVSSDISRLTELEADESFWVFVE